MKRTALVLAFLAVTLSLGLACDSATPVAPTDALIDVTVNPTRIASNGQADITIIGRKMDGFPLNPGTEINLSTNLGLIEPPMVLTDDRGMAATVLFGNGENGMATVTAISGGITQTADVQIGIPPFDLLLSLNPSTITIPFKGNRKTKIVKLLASVADQNGVEIPAVRVSFAATAGTLETDRVETDENGEARTKLTLTEADLARAVDGLVEVTAEVFASDGTSISDIQDVEVLGLPTFLVLETSQSSIPAGGGSLELAATVTDDLGDPVSGAGVQFETTVGSLASRGAVILTDRNGQSFDVLSASEQDLAAAVGNTFVVTANVSGTSSGVGDTSASTTIAIQGLAPIAGFTTTVNCTTVTFLNTSTPMSTTLDPVTFDWDFGDGTIQLNVDNPVHTYTTTGTKTVTLTATNAFGIDTVSQSVIVDPTPLPSFTFTLGTMLDVSFDASASIGAPPLTYAWGFGDGTTGSGVTVSHTYGSSGTKSVTLNVTTTCTGTAITSSTLTQTVVVPP